MTSYRALKQRRARTRHSIVAGRKNSRNLSINRSSKVNFSKERNSENSKIKQIVKSSANNPSKTMTSRADVIHHTTLKNTRNLLIRSYL